jgi:1-aminocyclopropane-1-carboxylate deaminase
MAADLIKQNSHLTTQLGTSPLQEIHSELLDRANIRLLVKRDDLIHPQFGGNKWRKLKYNLIEAKNNNYRRLLTFGGAWSNHIYATAAAGKFFGFETIGLIRGEEHTPLNATLSFARDCGMELHYLDRSRYRQKEQTAFIDDIKQRFGDVYLLPEGGSNSFAIKGCEEIVQEVDDDIDTPFDFICCASGTGATLAGLASAIQSNSYAKEQRAIGFSALKGGDFLHQDVKNFLNSDNIADHHKVIDDNFQVETGYHFGGYAKITDELAHFMQTFHQRFGFELDAVYTAKMFYGLFDMIRSGRFEPGTCIVAIHSGGIQGNQGFDLKMHSDLAELEL